MDVEPETADLDTDTITWGICESSQRKIADALDRDACDDAEDGEEDKGGEVEEDDNSEYEGRVKQRHRIHVGYGRPACAVPVPLPVPAGPGWLSVNIHQVWPTSSTKSGDRRGRVKSVRGDGQTCVPVLLYSLAQL